MKIGVIGPIWLNIPPKGYGGTELVVDNLVNGLVDKGHDVTLFGPKTATVKAKVFPTTDLPLREMGVEWKNVNYLLYHLTEAFDHASEFDILHMHLNKSQDYIALPLAARSKTPTIFTFHFDLSTLAQKPDRHKVLLKYKDLSFTSISNSQRAGMPFNFVATVYNSLDISLFPFIQTPKDYFVWIGKVNPRKGTKEAILAAKQAGAKLLMMGAVDPGVAEMLTYYEKEIKPLVDGTQIVWLGEVSVADKAKYLGGAKAFLNPIQWEEPFGLVMTEALAAGTPVITFRRGAAPEIVVDSQTGFVVDDLSQMVAKMKEVDTINRLLCRKRVEENFSIPTMVAGYEKAYNSVIQKK